MEPWFTREQLAVHLQVDVRTIDRLVKEGMPSQKWGLRLRRFRLSEVEPWLAQR